MACSEVQDSLGKQTVLDPGGKDHGIPQSDELGIRQRSKILDALLVGYTAPGSVAIAGDLIDRGDTIHTLLLVFGLQSAQGIRRHQLAGAVPLCQPAIYAQRLPCRVASSKDCSTAQV